MGVLFTVILSESLFVFFSITKFSEKYVSLTQLKRDANISMIHDNKVSYFQCGNQINLTDKVYT